MFPIGQALAALPGIRTEDGIYTHAVGLKGEPSSYPTESAHLQGNAHWDYWKDARIFRHIAPLMGIAVERATDARWLPEHDMPAPVQSLVRSTVERRVGQAWHSECETCR